MSADELFAQLPLPKSNDRVKLLDRKRNLNADELVSRITPDNVHSEICPSSPVGREVLPPYEGKEV
jgi:hypothetical protein